MTLVRCYRATYASAVYSTPTIFQLRSVLAGRAAQLVILTPFMYQTTLSPVAVLRGYSLLTSDV